MPDQATKAPAPKAAEPEDNRFLLENKSFVQDLLEQIKDLFAPKPPELVLESKPIAVKDIWAPPKSIKSRIGSFAVHAAVIGILMLPFWRPVRMQLKKVVDVPIFVPPKVTPPMPKMQRLAGGGAPVVHQQPKMVQTPRPHPLAAPTSIVPIAEAMSAPSFGAIGPIAGPPGDSGGSGGGSGGYGSGEGGTCTGPDCGEGGDVATGPIPIYQPDPEYSEAARKAKFQGTCIVNVTIGTDGRVTHPVITQPLGLGLDQMAIAAVLKWRFIPAKDKDGRPIASVAQVELNFHLY
jgi:periplasmic protein TonB